MTPWTVPGRGGAQTEGEAGVATSGKPQAGGSDVPGELVVRGARHRVIILFGCGSVAMTVAALNQSDRGKLPFAASGDWLLITFGLGLRASPSPSRWPAASPARTSTRRSRSPRRCAAASRGARCPAYWAAQVFGAFVGAALVYLNYHDAIAASTRRTRSPAARPTRSRRSRSSPPSPRRTSTSPVGPLIDQIIGTALLVARHLRRDRRVQRARQGQPRAARRRPHRRRASASPSAPTPATRSTRRATSGRGCSPGSRAGSPSRCRATTATSTSTCGSRSWAR